MKYIPVLKLIESQAQNLLCQAIPKYYFLKQNIR